MTELSAITRSTPAGPVVELAGELDFYSASYAREATLGLTLEPGQVLIVDLQNLAVCDSSGIGILVIARNRALSAQAYIALVGVPDLLARMLDITGLASVFPAYATVPDAIAHWAKRID